VKFIEAFKAMKQGYKVKLPSWGGYWVYDAEGDRIWMHCKDGRVLEIRETETLTYTLENICSDEWVIADECNTPVLRGVAAFSFGEAIKYLKRGFKVKRQGWNGKDQYVELGYDFTYTAPGDIPVRPVQHLDIGSKALVFVGSRGRQVGWLASQADMLADDWIFVE
jgi:hypothetical protein